MASGYAPYDSPPRHRHSLSDATDSTPHQYPPPAFDTLSSAAASTVTITPKDAGRDLSRTPSPTPSEARELKTGAIDWKSLTKWRFWIRREWACEFFDVLNVVSAAQSGHTRVLCCDHHHCRNYGARLNLPQGDCPCVTACSRLASQVSSISPCCAPLLQRRRHQSCCHGVLSI